MSTRESEAPESSRTSDIRDYLPNAETIAKYADPAYSDQLFHEAMAASAKARRGAQHAVEERPVTKVIPGRDGQQKKKGWPLWWTIVFAIVAIGGPIAVLLIGKSIKEQPAVVPTATATITPSATVTAAPTVSSAPSTTAIPTASATATPATAPTAPATTKPSAAPRIAPKVVEPKSNATPAVKPSDTPPPPPPPKPTIID